MFSVISIFIKRKVSISIVVVSLKGGKQKLPRRINKITFKMVRDGDSDLSIGSTKHFANSDLPLSDNYSQRFVLWSSVQQLASQAFVGLFHFTSCPLLIIISSLSCNYQLKN